MNKIPILNEVKYRNISFHDKSYLMKKIINLFRSRYGPPLMKNK